MINGNATNLDRLHDLLADRATQYISRDEHDELTALLEANPDADDASFDRAAAAAELSWIAGEFEPMPNELRGRVEVQAVAWIAEQKGLTLVRGDEATPRSRTWIPGSPGCWRPRAWPSPSWAGGRPSNRHQHGGQRS
jgi:hypothetical protein